MTVVRPIKIVSPITGTSCTPKLREFRSGDRIFQEAIWTDFVTGSFIQKGIVKVMDAKTGKDITADID